MTYKKWAERSFWPNVDKTEDGCWLWTACVNRKGYGVLGCRRHGTWLAHRFVWKIKHGRLPKGGGKKDSVCVLHTCDNPACVKPEHLFLGTRADNIADAKRKGRHGTGEKKARKGEAHGMSKLVTDQVKHIRDLLSRGADKKLLAASFGVTRQCIDRIGQRISWRHV